MARVTRGVASIVTPILAVLALAACGGGTSTKEKNAYAQSVNAAQTKFASTVETVTHEGGPKSSIVEQRRTLLRYEAAIVDVVDDLRRIDAPSEVSREHGQLVSVMRRFANDIGQANDAMRSPTSRAIESAKRDLKSATQSVNARVGAAVAAINVKLRGD
ncbi:MAG: hypothetical protein LC790_03875 [Actinobacteria bacterium]|nr:hypothetical protein [Actinomycetota bacterium]